MSWEENVEIFKDTEKLCRTNPFLIQAWKKSSENQKLILEKDNIACDKNKYEKSVEIKVSKKRTFQAAMDYCGKKIAVLNFASANSPGGGVVNGSSAQEESLCRCSTLYFNLTEDFMWKNFYLPHRYQLNPLYNDDLIYTPDVLIFKSDTDCPRLMPEENWKKVNVITCAAPNLGEKPAKISDSELELIHIKRGRKILEVACANENEVVILGAFGCGAFGNTPQVVAKAYEKLLEEFKNSFETIEFAVYCSPRDDSNFRSFNSVFGNK